MFFVNYSFRLPKTEMDILMTAKVPKQSMCEDVLDKLGSLKNRVCYEYDELPFSLTETNLCSYIFDSLDEMHSVKVSYGDVSVVCEKP